MRNIVVGEVTKSDDTLLWHIRLGHRGEHGMIEIHKRNMLKVVKSRKQNF